MMYAQAQMTAPAAPRWISRWIVRRWIIYFIIGIAYVSRLLSIGQLTWACAILLTALYGGWVGIYRMWGHTDGQPPRWWFLTLFSLASASQFMPLTSTNLSWLPILPTTTACLITAMPPRYLGLIASGSLWLSSSLAFSLIMHRWDLDAQLPLLLSFSSFVGLSVTIRELMMAHKALESSNAKLAVAHTQLQEYSHQVEEMAAIRERNRIAREIHDTLGHSLTLLAVQLEAATQFAARGDTSMREELLEARRVAKVCLAEVRHSVEALRPDVASLQDRLRRLVAEFAASCHETVITLDLDEVTHPLNPELSMTLYRCAQEALTNVRKHAHATKVLLYLSTSDDPAEQVELTVLDNGKGAVSGSDDRTRGFGLLGMRERVALLDGTVRAGPGTGHGWRLEVVIPLNQHEPVVAIARSTRETQGK